MRTNHSKFMAWNACNAAYLHVHSAILSLKDYLIGLPNFDREHLIKLITPEECTAVRARAEEKELSAPRGGASRAQKHQAAAKPRRILRQKHQAARKNTKPRWQAPAAPGAGAAPVSSALPAFS